MLFDSHPPPTEKYFCSEVGCYGFLLLATRSLILGVDLRTKHLGDVL